MILIGRYLSPYTRRVAVSLHLLGLPFERKAINAWQNLDELRRVNPSGRVPALVLDDGEIVFESSAILDHIDEVVGPDRALLPASGAERRAQLRAVSVGLGVMDKAAATRYELVMRPEEKIHQPWLDHNLGQVRSGLEWLDAQARDWGGAMGQAQITAVVAYDFLGVALAEHVSLDAYPALGQLSARAAAEPAFRDTRPEIDQ